MEPFYFLANKFPTGDDQILFFVLLTLNSMAIPFIVLGIIKKKKSIIDPLINTSYSSISIIILNVLMFLAGLQLI